MTDVDGDRELQLYLILPSDCSPAQLAAALEAAPIACLLLPGPLAEQEATARRLIMLAQEAGTACLIAEDADLARRLGADGLHLSQPTQTAALRRRLGGKAILGVYCATSRHFAMEAGEDGADYIAFDAGAPERAETKEDEGDEGDEAVGSLAILSWWQALMTLPCVAWGVRDIEAAVKFAEAGADVLALTPDWLATPSRLSALVERLSRN